MSASPPQADLVGARGAVGRSLTRRLATDLSLRAWSGEPGAESYAAFEESWRSRDIDARRCPVIVAGGRTGGTNAALVEEHAGRVARLADLWNVTGWPSVVVLVGSAAELLPDSAYGAAKRAQRDIAESAARRAGASLVTLRLHSLVPDEPPRRGLLADVLAGFAAGGPVKVMHLNGLRDYVSEEQLELAVRAAIAAPRAPGARVVDVGTGRGLRVGDWIDGFAAAFGGRPRLEVARPDTADLEIVADAGPVRALVAGLGPQALARWDAACPVPPVWAARWVRR